MNTLTKLFWESTRSARLITLTTALFAALGVFLRRDHPVGSIQLLLTSAPWWVWSGALFVIAVNRWWCLWYSPKCNDVCISTVPAMLTSALALLVWSSLLVSACVFQDYGLAAMLVTCDLIEFWLLARIFTERVERKRLKHE